MIHETKFEKMEVLTLQKKVFLLVGEMTIIKNIALSTVVSVGSIVWGITEEFGGECTDRCQNELPN